MIAALRRWLGGTLRRQLTIGVGMVVGLAMALFVLDMTRRQADMAIERQSEEAVALARSISVSASAWMAARDYAGLQEIIDGLAGYPDLRHALVVDARGLVLAHDQPARRGLYLADLPAGGDAQVLQRSAMLVDVASPIVYGGRPVGWVRIGVGGQRLAAQIAEIRRDGALYGLAAVFAALAIAGLAGRYLTVRLARIQRVVDAVQGGDLTQRVGLSGDDEAGRLAAAFDGMLDALGLRTEELRASEQKLSTILDNVSAYIYLKDSEGRYLYANRWVRELFRLPLDEIVGCDDAVFFDGETLAQLRSNDRRVLHDGETLRVEETNVDRHTGQANTYLTVKLPLRREDGQIYALCGISTDISERKAAEVQLARHKDELEEEVRLRTADLMRARDAAEAASRAKSTFLANMSHELRTPMNGIIGMAALALRHAGDPKLREQLAMIDRSSKHLLGLINDILDLSKIEADRLQLERIDFRIGEIPANLLSLIGHRAAEKGLALRVDLPPGLAERPVRGDPLRLNQILLNLAGNALKFTEAGEIVIAARIEAEEADALRLRWEVRDTGIGIDENDRRRLFTAFEQADGSMTRRYGGTGLGLAISKRLVGLMGGEIGVDSRPGVGSTFWFTVRLDKAAPSALPVAAPEGSAERQLAAAFPGARILLVEDEPINQEVSRGLLEDAGLCVDLAEDGEIACTLARQQRYDLILMDMQMPRLSGVDAARAIRADSLNRTTPILAMTANVFEDDRRACAEAGMNGHIPKPVDPERLFESMLDALRAAVQTA